MIVVGDYIYSDLLCRSMRGYVIKLLPENRAIVKVGRKEIIANLEFWSKAERKDRKESKRC